MRGVLSLPEYTTVLGQTFSSCSRFYAAATRAGDLAIWRTGDMTGSEEVAAPLFKFRPQCSIRSLAATDRIRALCCWLRARYSAQRWGGRSHQVVGHQTWAAGDAHTPPTQGGGAGEARPREVHCRGIRQWSLDGMCRRSSPLALEPEFSVPEQPAAERVRS